MFDLDDNMWYYRTEEAFQSKIPAFSLFDVMEGINVSRTDRQQSWLPKIAEAALLGDSKKLEIVLIRAIRSLKGEAPEICQQLGQLLSEHSNNPNGLRWRGSGPPPVDADEGFALVRAESVEDAQAPVLPAPVMRRVDQFIVQRKNNQRLLQEGFLPPSSVLLTGAPGTGKTMLTQWIARELDLPFVALDLSTSISSFLGKTGFNLRRTLDYARSRPCALLLDEFDAIAKRRDDATEVGELKRIVNVLLKELEDWPLHSVLIAATNHPELLDRAIARRFDVVLEIPLPGDEERFEILKRSGRRFSEHIPTALLRGVASGLEGASGSELDSLMSAAVRHHLTTEQTLVRSLIKEIQLRIGDRMTSRNIGEFIRLIQSHANGQFKVRELAELFDKSPSTIQHHLNKEVQHG